MAKERPHNLDWDILYKTGGWAALIAALVFRRNLGAEAVLLHMVGIIPDVPTVSPVDAAGWFTLFNGQPFVGLALSEVSDIFNYALVGIIYLALCAALWKTNRSAVLIAGVSGISGVVIHFVGNQSMTLWRLSNLYGTAIDQAQRDMYLAAGEAVLAIYNPGQAFTGFGAMLALFLVTLAGLIFAILMLRSSYFGKRIAVIGIIAQVFGLLFFVIVPVAPSLNFVPPSVSAIFLLAWYILIGLKLVRMPANI